MNRYIYLLLLMFASLQAQISFSAISENAQNWENFIKMVSEDEEININSKIIHKFEKEFDLFVNKDSLSPEQLFAAFAIKCVCQTGLEKNIAFLAQHPNKLSKKDIENAAQQIGIACLANMSRAKTEYAYEQYVIPKQIYDKTTQEKLGDEKYEQVTTQAEQKIPGCLSFLVDDAILEKELLQKINELQKK